MKDHEQRLCACLDSYENLCRVDVSALLADFDVTRADLAHVTEERDALRRLAYSKGNAGPIITSLIRKNKALAARLAECEGLLRSNYWKYPALRMQWLIRREAYFAKHNEEEK